MTIPWKSLITSVVGGTLAALAWLFFTRGGLAGAIFGILMPLPLMMAGLAVGFLGILIAIVVALGVIGSMFGSVALLTYGSAIALPSFLVIFLSLMIRLGKNGQLQGYHYTPGSILAWLSAFVLIEFVLLAVGIYFLTGTSLEQLIQEQLNSFFPGFLQELNQSGQAAVATQVRNALPLLGRIFAGAIGMWIQALILVNMALAQGVLMRFNLNLRPPIRIADIVLPHWVSILVCLAIITYFITPLAMGKFLALNGVLILSIPIVAQGLGVLHAFAHTKQGGMWILVVFYISAAVIPWLFVPAIILGIVDEWLGLRQRFVAAQLQGEKKK